MHRFKELEIWKLSRLLSTEIYSMTANFPEAEKFGLTNQLRRAVVSIPSNIAEDSSRSSNKDFCRFLEIAQGSVYEVETQLLIASDLRFIQGENLNDLLYRLDTLVKMIIRFKRSCVKSCSR